MLYITGDTHGMIDIQKIKDMAGALHKEDYLLITGDFGVIWRNESDDLEESLISIYENLGCIVLWIDGNHENHVRINNLPVEEWHGGKTHRISENIIHLMRGEIFEIAGYKIFTMGGAASTDKEWRIPDVSWWKEEIPCEEEKKNALNNLKKAEYNIDFVITHTAPSHIIKEMNAFYRIDEYTDWLEGLSKKMNFFQWYFGHFHIDRTFENGKYIACFDEIAMLPEKINNNK